MCNVVHPLNLEQHARLFRSAGEEDRSCRGGMERRQLCSPRRGGEDGSREVGREELDFDGLDQAWDSRCSRVVALESSSSQFRLLFSAKRATHLEILDASLEPLWVELEGRVRRAVPREQGRRQIRHP